MIVDYTETYLKWFKRLKDADAKGSIKYRIRKIETDDFLGDYKSLGTGLFELRFHLSKGYRIFFMYRGQAVILLLTAGDKDGNGKSQDEDIKKARKLMKEFK